MAQHNDLGRWGEDLAAQYLREKGWYIRHRDWRDRHRDIDIVAIDEDSSVLLIVEVKTRSTDLWGDPDEAITLEKQANILRATASYQRLYRMEWINVRFDTISIVGSPDMPRESIRITHQENAFDVTSNFALHEQKRRQSYYKHRPGQW